MTNHCTYEQSQALKEIGFDLPVRDYYDDKPILRKTPYEYHYSGIGNLYASAPTHAEALEWLREKRKLFGFVLPVNDWNSWVIQINAEDTMSLLFVVFDALSDSIDYPTHHQATSALVDKMIEIIKEQKP